MDVASSNSSNEQSLSRDVLTGAFDRAAFEQHARGIIATTAITGLPLTLCVFDIDYFKSINDAYGHERGDQVLRSLVQCVHGLLRSSDALFRYGGDEFVVLLPQITGVIAVQIMQRILEAVKRSLIPGDPPLQISISAGIAEYGSDGTTLEALFHTADQRNYRAKRHGRARVVWNDIEGQETTQDKVGRVIERDNALDRVQRWLAPTTMATHPLLRIEGVAGSGRARFMREVQRLAHLQGQVILHLHGSRRRRWQAYGGIDFAAWPTLQNGRSDDPPGMAAQIWAVVEQQRGRGLFISIDEPGLIDPQTSRLIRYFLDHPGSQPVWVAYSTEPHASIPQYLEGHGQEYVYLQPLTLDGLRIWLRQVLHMEPPEALVTWFSQWTAGLPARFELAIQTLIDHQLLWGRANRWELSPEYELLRLIAPFDQTPPQPVRGMPPELTDFVGRTNEIEQLITRIDQSRLVTMLGPGGIGKTRLAAQLAMTLADEYADGVTFVQLAAINEPELLAGAIALVLEIRDESNHAPVEQLERFLAEKHMLLVLDNFEQIVDAADLIARLLVVAPRLTIVVTSRIVLDLYGERVFHVPPLQFPDHTDRLVLSEIWRYPALALFANRAQLVDDQFTLTHDNLAAIIQICTRLDGLPLAIELAAARCHTYSPADVAAQLDQRLQLLSHGPRDRVPRQRTLRGTIDWSYQLLTTTEQHLFRRLGIFTGSFVLQAVLALWQAATPPRDSIHSLEQMLESLADQSLLRRVDSPDLAEKRYVLLETIREYALDALQTHDEHTTASQAHLAYYSQFAEQADHGLTGADQQEWLERLERDYPNLRAALRWALDQQQSRAAGRLAGALARFWWMHSHLHEARQLLEETLQLVDCHASQLQDHDGKRIHSLLLLGLGTITWIQGDHRSAAHVLEAAVQLARQVDDPALLGYALNQAGLAYRDAHSYAIAELYFTESMHLRQTLGIERGTAVAMGNLGVTAFYQGQMKLARHYCEQSLSILRTIQDSWGIAMALFDLAKVLLAQHEYDQTRVCVEEMLQISRELGDQAQIAWGLEILGQISLQTGDSQRAITFLRNSLHICLQIGDKEGIAISLLDLAGCALAKQQFVCAAQLLGMEQRYRTRIGTPRSIWDEPIYATIIAELRTCLPSERLQAEIQHGLNLDPAHAECIVQLGYL